MNSMTSPATVTAANREAWLHQVAERMAPAFAEIGFPIPAFRASVGFPYGAEMATGQCWDKRVSGDGHFEIFINPGRDDSRAIASTLAHELAHAAAGLGCGHKGDFAKIVRALGFAGKLTHAQDLDAAPKLAEWIDEILAGTGPIPHAALSMNMRGAAKVAVKVGGGIARAPAGDDGDGEPAEGPISSRPKAQTGRLLKACCAECGYTVRVTAKWLEVGPPHCPSHGAMQPE
jgi:hypothetical protein